MGERKDDLGHAVVDGVPAYFSPSSLSAADPEQYGGCLRRWWYKYVGGRKEPFTADQRLGVEVHAQIEHYLLTGEKTLGQIAMAGFHFVPAPGASNLIEHFIGDGTLTAAGVRVLGYVDWMGPSTEPDDPPGTVEEIDWKSTGNIANNAKTASGLLATIQMPAYAKWHLGHSPNATHARMSHGYFQTKGRPQAQKVSVLCTREQIDRRWESVEAVARRIIDAAKETDPAKVEGYQPSCTAYRGCPHRDVCPQGKDRTIDEIFGKGGAMSLLEKLNLPTGVTPVAAAPVVQLDMKAELARLEAAERAAAAPPAPSVPAGFAEACGAIERAGMGFPQLQGEAAHAKCAMHGSEFKGAALSGSGRLAGMTLTTCAEVAQLAGELGHVATPAVPSMLAPETPASNPAIASLPVEGLTPPPGTTVTTTVTDRVGELEHTTSTTVAVAPEAPKRKAGRPRKAPAATDVIPGVPAGTPTAPTNTDATGLEVFVDCLPSCAYESLESYVSGLNAALCTQYGLIDLREAGENSPLGFGKWKAAIVACVRAAPPPAGTYFLDARGREVAEQVAEALRSMADLYVRGIR